MDFKSSNDYIKYNTNSFSGDSLPMQMLPRKKKNPRWQKTVMDTLEKIGLSQIKENRVFSDYRKMQEGRLIHSDLDITQSDLVGIAALRKEKRLETKLKHFDLIGRIINILVGEFNRQKDTIKITSIDPFSESEFLEEKTKRLREFTEKYFEKVIQINLIEKGIDPEFNNFKNEEEKQQYLAFLKEERDKIISPDKIEEDLRKNFKTLIVEWAERTNEANYTKFNLEYLDTQEVKDFLSTGRYFRNYYVGYDYFEPETWDVERVFLSKDSDVLYPSDCEYVGIIRTMSGAKVLSRYGHLIPKDIQEKLYGEDFYNHNNHSSKDPLNYLQKGGGIKTMVPHVGYFQNKVARAFEDITNLPWGEQYYNNSEGNLDKRYSWANRTSSIGTITGAMFRDDIKVRTDEIQVTEAYFRSQKLMGLLTIENPLINKPYQVMVEEDLIPEYLEHYNIKKQNKKSWKEVTDNPQDNINTITYGYLPEIWKGYKINCMNTNLKEDFYFGVAPLEYQIKGTRNDFDVKIPMGGIISNGIGQMIRNLQIAYNIVQNQNLQYLEKTIGTFFLMDWNLLPSQFKGENGANSAEKIEEWRETIRDSGIAQVDLSPQNTKGQNGGQNAIQAFDISFVNNIRVNNELARGFERDALAVIGLTPERVGSPNEYSTAEGIKQGREASYAQTEFLYLKFNTAKIKEKEIELAVAQYCESNKKEISVNYLDNKEQQFIRKYVDKNFPFRKIGVLPSDDSSEKRDLQSLKQIILQRNTMDASIYDLTKIVTSKNFVSLLEYGLEQEEKKRKELQETRAFEEKMKNDSIEAQKQINQSNIERQDRKDRLDRESKEYIAEIKVKATLADSNTDPSMLNKLIEEQKNQEVLRDRKIKNDIKYKEISLKEKKQTKELENDDSKLDLEFLKLKEKAKDRVNRRNISKDNLDIAIIND